MRIKVITKMACDFCGKSQDDVALLIAGPRDIAICNECVDLCVGVIAKEKPETAEPARLSSTEVMSDRSDVLAELRKQTPLLEVLAKQGDITVAARSTACADLCSVIRPATGAAASGLPG